MKKNQYYKQLLELCNLELYNRMRGHTQWCNIARKNQLPPPDPWYIWLILAGRGFGKTRAASELVKSWGETGKYKRIALIGNTISEVMHVMLNGESGILSISQKNKGIKFLPSKKMITWPSGAVATFYSAEKYDQLRGPQFDAAWIDEISKFSHPKEVFDQLSFSLRLGNDPKIVITTTPKSIKFLRDLINRKDVSISRGTSIENKANLAPSFLTQIEYLKGTPLEAQEIYGEIVDVDQNALWTWDDISSAQKSSPQEFSRIIISVDPAISSSSHSDETGIIVAGLDCGNIYILNDSSMLATPDLWIAKVVELYKYYNADLVVIEKNAGGNLLETAIHSIEKNVRIKMVFATKSKRERAAPVALLYKKGKIFHTKQFTTLESQMTASKISNSPDRLDALVWAVKELTTNSENYFDIPHSWVG